MFYVTIMASLDRSILKVGPELLNDRWFHATLADAYFGFITFYVWVAYKEKKLAAKLIWFMLLGNIAMSIYVLSQLSKLKSGAPIHHVLFRREHIGSAS